MNYKKESKAFRVFLLTILSLIGLSIIASAEFPAPYWPPTPYNLEGNYLSVTPPSVGLSWTCGPFEGDYVMARRQLFSGDWNVITVDPYPLYSYYTMCNDYDVDGVSEYEYGLWSRSSVFPYYWSLTYGGSGVVSPPGNTPEIHAEWVDCGWPDAVYNDVYEDNNQIGSHYYNCHHFSFKTYDGSPTGYCWWAGENISTFMHLVWTDANNETISDKWWQEYNNHQSMNQITGGEYACPDDPNVADLAIITDIYDLVNYQPKSYILSLNQDHPLPWKMHKYGIYAQSIWTSGLEGNEMYTCWGPNQMYLESHCTINYNGYLDEWTVTNVSGGLNQ